MSSLSEEKDLFSKLHSFLVTTGKLDETDANIYVLALKKGVIKSSDVSEEFSRIRPNAAIARLKGLAKKGLLEVAPKETIGKRPYGMIFKAIHPRTALKDVVEKSLELPHLLERYNEHWEILSEKPAQDTKIWLTKSAKAAKRIGCSMLGGAKQEIKIYCHDCSWFEILDIQTSLETAVANGVTVVVIANNPPKHIVEKLTQTGISLYICESSYGLPFCIIDNCWLFLPTQSGILSKQYCAIRTNDKYMVDNFANLFDTALSCSELWRK